MLDFFYTIIIGSISYMISAPFTEMFNNPFFATSLRDFWSNRSNKFIQRNIAILSFKPTVRALNYLLDIKDKKKTPGWVLMIAGMNAFIFSALFHEVLMYFVLDGIGVEFELTWEQFLFFGIQGVVMSFEIFVGKLFKLEIGNFLGWLWATAVMLLTSPLFLNPLLKGNILHLVFENLAVL